MRGPMYDHALLYERDRPLVHEAVARVLERGLIDWGPEVPAFEIDLAQWLGAAHVVATNSGTAALKVALLALGIRAGDEVITAPNSDIGTAAAIHHVGARIVWVDVEDDTLNIDPARIEAAITPRTKALMPVHLFGHPADMPAVREIAHRHGLAVIEDACLALGASIHARPVGLWADVACFSHAPTKHLPACGSGGCAVTQDAEIAARMRRFAGYGQDREAHYLRRYAGRPQVYEVTGLNERMDEVQAAILRARLPGLRAAIARRIADADLYGEALAGSAVVLPARRVGCVHSYRNYVVRVADRARVQARLARAGIATALPYVPLLPLQPAFAHLGCRREDFPVASLASEQVLALPIGPHLDDEQYAYVARVLLSA
jgi:dTDP-4-amino-4,6-dideoxygalactose transaminase